jgi:glycosyltransferase involved in cell wall biosynthesis
MRILMISDFYQPFLGGVEQHVNNLACALVHRGHHVAVATLRHGSLASREVKDGVSIYRLDGVAQRFTGLFKNEHRRWAPPVPDPGLAKGLLGVIREEEPDVVHGHDWLARSFVPLKPLVGARFVVSLHYYTRTCSKKDLLYDDQPCAGPGLAKCVSCGSKHYGRAKGLPIVLGNRLGAAGEDWAADHYIAVSQSVARMNQLDRSGRPYSVVPNFVPDVCPTSALARANLRQLPRRPFILFVGDLRAYKGIDVLLRAYSQLQTGVPLVLIGKIWPESPRSFPPGVRIVTDCPNQAVLGAWQRALFGVVPSIGPEAFGLVAIEAFAGGKPVVASRIGGLQEIVQPDINGLLVPPNDVPSLAAALQRLLDDTDLRTQLASGARITAADYRASAVVPRIEDIYAIR